MSYNNARANYGVHRGGVSLVKVANRQHQNGHEPDGSPGSGPLRSLSGSDEESGDREAGGNHFPGNQSDGGSAGPVLIRPMSDAQQSQKGSRRDEAAADAAVERIDPRLMLALLLFEWPDEAAAFRKVLRQVARLANNGDEGLLELERLFRGDTSGSSNDREAPADTGTPVELREARERFESQYIRAVVAANDGSIQSAAAELGIDRTTLWKKMKSRDR